MTTDVVREISPRATGPDAAQCAAAVTSPSVVDGAARPRRPSRTTGRSAPLDGRLDRLWPTQTPRPGQRGRRRRAESGSIAWLNAYGLWEGAGLGDCAALAVWTFPPTRQPHLHRGRRTLCGWVAFGDPPVMTGYESAAERDVLLDLDFDQHVVAVAAQPFVLRLADDREHRPDYAALLTGGRVVILEVKDDADARVVHEAEAATAQLCVTLAELGWTYLTVTPTAVTRLRNLRWLRGCRPQSDELADLTDLMLTAAAGQTTIGALVALAHPAISRPVLGRLLWEQRLLCDLSSALSDDTLVRPATAIECTSGSGDPSPGRDRLAMAGTR